MKRLRRTSPSSAIAAVAAVAVSALLAALPSAQAQVTAGPVSGIDRAAIDPAVRAQDDLYRHVNGTWLKTAAIPADKSVIGALQEMFDATQTGLLALIEKAQRPGADAQAKKIGDLYASFMDEAAIEKLGVKPLAGELAAIDAVADRRQFSALMPRLERLGVPMPIATDIGQDDRDATRYVPSFSQSGLGLPNRDYYLATDDPKFRAVREKYVQYVATMLALAAGSTVKDTTASAQAVLALETDLARVQWSEVERRDPVKGYNPVELNALPALAPAIDWKAYLAAAGLEGKTAKVLVRQPGYLRGMSALLESTPLPTWKAYAHMRLLEAYAPYLGKAFVDARFGFIGGVLYGQPQNRPRERRGVTLVDASIGEGLGQLYVAAYFPPENKARMEGLVANLLTAYRDSIGKLDWMGPETQKEALAKLARFNSKIGYPKRWIDYGPLEIRRDDLVGNVMRANRFETARQRAKLGLAVDRDEWGITPQTINAYYNPSMNEIVFPAAFLQPPNFTAAADDAVNYGAIGAVIGHEISHGFDDQGSQYDGDGNLRDWWTAKDKANFAVKTQALVAQYNAFIALPPDYRVNGELTLGENIADNSGLAIAYKAYQLSLAGKSAKVIDGMSGDERFFFGFAQVWRGKQRDDATLAQIKSDPHSPEEFRVIGAVRNHPAFYSTFGVKPGDRMYLAPKDRVSIW